MVDSRRFTNQGSHQCEHWCQQLSTGQLHVDVESPLRECHTKKEHHLWGGVLSGGLEEIRTPDPHNANVVRSQLRYEPIDYIEIIILRPIFVKRF